MAASENNKGDKKINLQISVNGTPVHINADTGEPLVSLIKPSLEKAKVSADPDPEKWLFKDEAGNELDKSQTVGSFNFAKHAVIFLSLKAGIAG
jgi:hypothetical protein